IFDERDRFAQGAVSVVELRGAFERKIALELYGADEIIRVQLPAQLVEAPLERFGIELQLSGHAEEGEVIRAGGERQNLAAGGTEVRATGSFAAAPAGSSGSGRSCRRSVHRMNSLLPQRGKGSETDGPGSPCPVQAPRR